MDKTLRKQLFANITQTALADAFGISRKAVCKWTQVPAERVLTVEKLTGVHRSLIRPDLYPPEEYMQ